MLEGFLHVLQFIGLTAGEAFVVVFLGSLIISAHMWPRMGASVGGWVHARKRPHAQASGRADSTDK